MLSEPLTLYKLMILYMLKQVKFPLKNSQLSEFFLGKGYTNYFTLQQAISELLETNLISQEKIHTSSRYEITREGEETLKFFGSTISDAIRADIDLYLKDNKLRLRNEVSVVADYFKSTTSDYVCRLEIREGKSTLLSVQLSVPSDDQAEIVCENWQDSNQHIYAHLMQELLKSRAKNSSAGNAEKEPGEQEKTESSGESPQ